MGFEKAKSCSVKQLWLFKNTYERTLYVIHSPPCSLNSLPLSLTSGPHSYSLQYLDEHISLPRAPVAKLALSRAAAVMAAAELAPASGSANGPSLSSSR